MFTGATLLVLLVIAGSLWWLIFEVRLSRREFVNSGVECLHGDDDCCEFVAEDRNVPGMVSLAEAVKRIEAFRGDV